jgi:hypothetical protein
VQEVKKPSRQRSDKGSAFFGSEAIGLDSRKATQTGAMSISEIATACGYRDYSYFARVFKRSTGKTPLQSINYMNVKKGCPE